MINAMNVFLAFGGFILVAAILVGQSRARARAESDSQPPPGPPGRMPTHPPGSGLLLPVTVDDVIAHYDIRMKELADRLAYDLNIALEADTIVDLDIECYIDIVAKHSTRRVTDVLHVGSGIQSKVRR